MWHLLWRSNLFFFSLFFHIDAFCHLSGSNIPALIHFSRVFFSLSLHNINEIFLLGFICIFIFGAFIVRKRVAVNMIRLRLIESRNLMTTYSTFMTFFFPFHFPFYRSLRTNQFCAAFEMKNQDNNVL